MEEKKPIDNLIILSGEITHLFEKRSEKSPQEFMIRARERWEIEKEGVKEERTRVNTLRGVSFNFPEDLSVGDIVKCIGSIENNKYTDKEGKDHWNMRLMFRKFEKIGRNSAVDEVVPKDVPEENINYDNIPF